MSYEKTIASAALKVIEYLMKHPETFKKGVQGAQGVLKSVVDFVQVASGSVNLDNAEQAIEKACGSCIRKGREDQVKIAAFISALYLQYHGRIERAAQVGGSLRKRFGVSWFPHIHERELRYAFDVDSELENYVFEEMKKGSYVQPSAEAPSGSWIL